MELNNAQTEKSSKCLSGVGVGGRTVFAKVSIYLYWFWLWVGGSACSTNRLTDSWTNARSRAEQSRAEQRDRDRMEGCNLPSQIDIADPLQRTYLAVQSSPATVNNNLLYWMAPANLSDWLHKIVFTVEHQFHKLNRIFLKSITSQLLLRPTSSSPSTNCQQLVSRWSLYDTAKDDTRLLLGIKNCINKSFWWNYTISSNINTLIR